MPQLTALPAELLALITTQLHPLDLYNLYLTGSSLLNAKLVNSVYKLQLVFSSVFDSPPWPFLLRQLTHLQLLVVRDCIARPISNMPTTFLANASLTVQQMTLEIPGAFTALQELLQQSDAFPVLDSLTISNISQEEQLKNSVIPRWPRSLKSLTSRCAPASRWHLDLSTLPPNLTTLVGYYAKIVYPSTVNFPESLTSLKITLCRLTCDLVPLLPHGLSTLDFHVSFEGKAEEGDISLRQGGLKKWAENSIPLLPRTLLYLKWPLNSVWNRESLKALPSTLTHLEDADLCSTDFDALPRSLTYCHACADLSMPAMQTVELARLPKCLAKVHLTASALAHFFPDAPASVVLSKAAYGLVDELRACQITALSPNITSLTLYATERVPFEMLPKNLTFLAFTVGKLTLREVDLLPKTLKELHMQHAYVEAETWKQLPRQLEILTTNVETLPVESSSWIPTTLRVLKIFSSVEIPIDWFAHLPSLETLELQPLFKSPSEWHPRLPSSLVDLSLTFRTNQGKAHMTQAITRGIMPGMLAAGLPDMLQHLRIALEYQAAMDYAMEDLKHLPRRLTRLYLPHNPTLDAQQLITLLPKSLLSACFGHRSLLLDMQNGGIPSLITM